MIVRRAFRDLWFQGPLELELRPTRRSHADAAIRRSTLTCSTQPDCIVLYLPTTPLCFLRNMHANA